MFSCGLGIRGDDRTSDGIAALLSDTNGLVALTCRRISRRRDDIRDMRVTKLSAMPADLDTQITVDQMADLLRFLKP